MWSFPAKQSAASSSVHVWAYRGGRPASFADVIRAWREDAAFRAAFNEAIVQNAAREIRWETPGLTTKTLKNPFECVLVASPELATSANPAAFHDHLAKAKSDIVTFMNLSGDAQLVVPCEVGPREAYAHLGAFIRSAPSPQRDSFWKAIGDAMHARVGRTCVWLSTAGAGVPWLHARLDDRPKYYSHVPY